MLMLWEGGVRLGLVSALFFPPPSTIAATISRLTREADLAAHTGMTLQRLALGSMLGGVPALAAGWLMGWSRRLRDVVDPLVAAAHPIPKIALLPIFMVIFGIGELSKIVAIAVSVFFPLVLNAMSGVRQISPIHFEVAHNLDAGRFRTLFRVVIPGSLPSVMTGVRIALNIGLLVTVAIELVASNTGLGARLWLGWQTFRPKEIWAVIALLSAIGLVMNGLLRLVARLIVPWQIESDD
jgi:NitT/TauT family transport system permease protein